MGSWDLMSWAALSAKSHLSTPSCLSSSWRCLLESILLPVMSGSTHSCCWSHDAKILPWIDQTHLVHPSFFVFFKSNPKFWVCSKLGQQYKTYMFHRDSTKTHTKKVSLLFAFKKKLSRSTLLWTACLWAWSLLWGGDLKAKSTGGKPMRESLLRDRNKNYPYSHCSKTGGARAQI